MAVTACLFNLSKADLCSRIHPGVLKEIVQIDLDAMETFPQHQQVNKHSSYDKTRQSYGWTEWAEIFFGYSWLAVLG